MIRVHEEYEITDKDLNKKCDQCDEVFNDPQEFDDHLRLCLKDPKDFSCKFCETKWVSHQSLELGVSDLVPGNLVPKILNLRFGAYNLVPRRFSAWEI